MIPYPTLQQRVPRFPAFLASNVFLPCMFGLFLAPRTRSHRMQHLAPITTAPGPARATQLRRQAESGVEHDAWSGPVQFARLFRVRQRHLLPPASMREELFCAAACSVRWGRAVVPEGGEVLTVRP